MAWTANSTVLVTQIRNFLENITDAHTLRMVPAWARAWDDLVPDLEAALNELALQAVDGRIRRSDVIKAKRLQGAIEAIQVQLTELVGDSENNIINKLPEVVDYSGAMQERLIGSQLPASEQSIVNAWSKVDAGQIGAIVERTTEQITKLSYPLSDEATAAMRRHLVRGIALGDNPRAAAARMVKQVEGLFNGGLSRALTIARTEMLDAHRAAAQLGQAANADLLEGWIWSASLSTRTCDACWGMDGHEFPITQAGPEGHQNCRCARVPKTKTWAELGFEGIEEPPSILPDAAAQFEALSKADQVTILGRKKYDAWSSGHFPMSDWATKRKNPGWRDSWVPAKAPTAA